MLPPAAKLAPYLILLVFTFTSCSSPEQITSSKLAELLNKLRKEARAPGAIVAVKYNRGESMAVASGFADQATLRKMKPDTPYYIGSITKVYTAVTILKLVEEKRISLDDTLERFLPSFPEGKRITIRHLLQHTSGLKDFYMYLYYRPERNEMIRLVTKRWSQEELIELAGRFGRWFDPGTDWSYSSTNYFLLGVIVEKVTGLKLPEAYRQYIFEPLNIKRTWLSKYESERELIPIGYMGRVREWKHSEMFGELGPTTVLDQSSAEWSAGGLIAPANETIAFLNGLFQEKLISASTLKTMTQFHPTPPLGVTEDENVQNSSDGYGLGLIKMQLDAFTLIGHGGMFNGHTAGLWYIPDRGITIALYFNRGFVDQRKILKQLLPAIAPPLPYVQEQPRQSM